MVLGQKYDSKKICNIMWKKLKYFVDAPSDNQKDKDIKIHGNKSLKNQKKVNNNVKRLIESVSYDTMQMLKSAI